MLKKTLATGVFTLGVCLAGAALAQTPYGSGNGQWSSQSYQADMRQEGMDFTSALNDLYSHGFHNVHDLSMQGGFVQATAISPHGIPRTVDVSPGSGQISLG